MEAWWEVEEAVVTSSQREVWILSGCECCWENYTTGLSVMIRWRGRGLNRPRGEDRTVIEGCDGGSESREEHWGS